MSFFARASWPGDHRDEVVAGALAAAVIVVLGYASGIGAPAPQSVDTAAPPATTAPADPPASNTPGSAEPPATSADADAGAGAGSGVLPVGDAPPVTGGTGAGGHGGHHGKGVQGIRRDLPERPRNRRPRVRLPRRANRVTTVSCGLCSPCSAARTMRRPASWTDCRSLLLPLPLPLFRRRCLRHPCQLCPMGPSVLA